MNKAVLVGRLTRDPEVRATQSGVAVARFSVAVDRPFANQAGERETDFIDVVVWRKQAETVGQYLKKGRLVGVEGAIQTRTYEKDGQKRRAWEVVADRVEFLDRGSDAPARAPANQAGQEERSGVEDRNPETFGDEVGPEQVPF
ncbi:MAG: single-stranded DNA-binding protein [Clostridia bacterium]|nr:single-stranded DNA-binding protein [Clostridia bacterium]